MYYEESQISPTLIGRYPATDRNFTLKTNINEQSVNFSRPSYVSITEISSGSSNWAVLEGIGTYEMVVDLNVVAPQNALVTAYSKDWVENDTTGVIRILEETTQTIKQIKKDSVLTLIEEIRKNKTIPHSEQIANRLYQLNDDVLDDYPEDDLISPDSLLDYYLFLRVNKSLTFPAISVTPDGNIWIQWESSVNHHFSVEFKGHGDVIFVVFAPDKHVPSKINRVSGKSTIESLMEQVQHYQVNSWILIKEKVA
jgi:hypothetical protein